MSTAFVFTFFLLYIFFSQQRWIFSSGRCGLEPKQETTILKNNNNKKNWNQNTADSKGHNFYLRVWCKL